MSDQRIAAITLDERSVLRRSPEIEQERAGAIADLLHSNSFAPTTVSVSGNHWSPRFAMPSARAISIMDVHISATSYFARCLPKKASTLLQPSMAASGR